MGILNILKKDIDLFPPFLVEGESLASACRRVYLQFSETFNSILVTLIFINYIFFCGEQQKTQEVFRIFNIVISSLITFDFLFKLLLIRPLYFNKYYYGWQFVIFDVLSGPASLILNIYNATQSAEVLGVTYSDIMILFRIFCMERIRLLIRDVAHILYVSRYINLALCLAFYLYSYFAYRLFQAIAPKYFKNLFVSMLSMFQVLTLDSWNLQVNQSVSSQYGQIWSLFFIFFIIFMFFYFINLLLGAFVSYYSNPNLRMNFEYDYDHDDILNPELHEEHKQTVEISKALHILGLQQDEQELDRQRWLLGGRQNFIYVYVVIQIVFEILLIQVPSDATTEFYFVFEQMFGILYCLYFVVKVREYQVFKGDIKVGEQSVDDRQQENEEQTVRIYILVILFICGPFATGLDIGTVIVNHNLVLQYGPGARIWIVLAVDSVQKAIFKFVEVLPGVSHIILFVAGLLFTFCLIGHQFLKPVDAQLDYPCFDTMTSTYLFMLQVITFDSWGDVARVVIKEKGFFFVLYFLFLTIFIGFFLLNMLVGIMATMTQPKTQELFEKEHILRQRVNQTAVQQLKEQIDIHQKSQQKEDEIAQLKQILDNFNSSQDPDDKLYVFLGGQQYEIVTKNFIVFDDDQ